MRFFFRWHSLLPMNSRASCSRWSCSVKRAGPDDLQRSFPTSSSLWLCDLISSISFYTNIHNRYTFSLAFSKLFSFFLIMASEQLLRYRPYVYFCVLILIGTSFWVASYPSLLYCDLLNEAAMEHMELESFQVKLNEECSCMPPAKELQFIGQPRVHPLIKVCAM